MPTNGWGDRTSGIDIVYREYAEAMSVHLGVSPPRQSPSIISSLKGFIQRGSAQNIVVYLKTNGDRFIVNGQTQNLLFSIEDDTIHLWKNWQYAKDARPLLIGLAEREGLTMGNAKMEFNLDGIYNVDSLVWQNPPELDDSYLFEGVELANGHNEEDVYRFDPRMAWTTTASSSYGVTMTEDIPF